MIVVDDNSADGPLNIAKQYADGAVGKVREGQTKGLLYGMKYAKFPVIVTIDSDLENSPELIPALIKKLDDKWLSRLLRLVNNYITIFFYQFKPLF